MEILNGGVEVGPERAGEILHPPARSADLDLPADLVGGRYTAAVVDERAMASLARRTVEQPPFAAGVDALDEMNGGLPVAREWERGYRRRSAKPTIGRAGTA